jgi:hypothetical protein
MEQKKHSIFEYNLSIILWRFTGKNFKNDIWQEMSEMQKSLN